MSHFIDDGFTLRTQIDAVGPFDGFSLEYRPALPGDVQAFHAAPKSTSASHDRIVGEFVAKHAVGWSIEDANGKPLPVTAPLVCKLPPTQQTQIVAAITGYDLGKWEAVRKN